MRIVKEQQLFFGCKIDSKLRDALANAKPGDRHYFEDSEFLRICETGEQKWIGKVIRGGAGVNDVEDIQRNVISILRRIAPDIRLTSASVKIFATREGEAGTIEPVGSPGSNDESSGGGNRGGGPYIDY